MSVEMSPEEIDQYLKGQHTVTLITLNKDGTPLPAPLWFVNQGATIYAGTMRRLQKVKNILRDPRVTAQVEDGKRYVDLRAVIVRGRAEAVEDPEELAWFNQQMDAKYAAYRPQMRSMPAATQRHYDNPRVVFKVVPEKIKTWDNSKLRRKEPESEPASAG